MPKTKPQPKRPPGRPRKINLEEAIRLLEQGKTVRQLAPRYDVTTASFYQLLKRHGFQVGNALDKNAGEREEDSIIRAD